MCTLVSSRDDCILEFGGMSERVEQDKYIVSSTKSPAAERKQKEKRKKKCEDECHMRTGDEADGQRPRQLLFNCVPCGFRK